MIGEVAKHYVLFPITCIVGLPDGTVPVEGIQDPTLQHRMVSAVARALREKLDLHLASNASMHFTGSSVKQRTVAQHGYIVNCYVQFARLPPGVSKLHRNRWDQGRHDYRACEKILKDHNATVHHTEERLSPSYERFSHTCAVQLNLEGARRLPKHQFFSDLGTALENIPSETTNTVNEGVNWSFSNSDEARPGRIAGLPQRVSEETPAYEGDATTAMAEKMAMRLIDPNFAGTNTILAHDITTMDKESVKYDPNMSDRHALLFNQLLSLIHI